MLARDMFLGHLRNGRLDALLQSEAQTHRAIAVRDYDEDEADESDESDWASVLDVAQEPSRQEGS